VTKISVEHDFIQKLLNLLPKTLMSWNSLALAHYVAHKVPGKPIRSSLHHTHFNGQRRDNSTVREHELFQNLLNLLPRQTLMSWNGLSLAHYILGALPSFPNWLAWHITQHKGQGL
jgi:hypothetical protein